VTTHSAKAGIFSRRLLAVAATAGLTLSLALTMGVAMANDLHQDTGDTGIAWNDPGFQGSADDCANANLDPGQVLWHFVHTQTGSGDLPSTITAEFDTAGTLHADGYVNGNSIVMYNIITGQDSLLSASDSIQNDGLLNLSHICSGGEEQSIAESVSESVSESVGESVGESVAESASGEQSVEAGTGTPVESTPDGALPFGGSSPLPMIAFSLILLTSLGSLAYANVKAVRKN
jgi:hypothetical protein